MSKILSIKKTAYHEAGHAIACHFLHMPFNYVSIKSGEDFLGRVVRFPHPEPFNPDIDSESSRARIRIEKSIMISCAGHAAELNLTGRRNWVGSSYDNQKASELAMYFCGSERQTGAFMDWMWIRIIDWIKQPLHWIAVEAVAEELVKSKQLKAMEVRAIIYKAIESKTGIKLNLTKKRIVD